MNLQNSRSMIAVSGILFFAIGIDGRAHELRGAFTDVKPLDGDVNSPYHELRGLVSGNGLTLVFTSDRPGGKGGFDIYIAERQDTGHPFTEVENLAVNTEMNEYATFLSEDGECLYYMLCPLAGKQCDLYFAKRAVATAGVPFENPTPMDELNTIYFEGGLSLTADGSLACFLSDRPRGKGLRDLWVATWDSDGNLFTNATNLEELNTPGEDAGVSISPSGLTIFWSDNPWEEDRREGGMGGSDIWCAARNSRGAKFGPAVNLGSPINTSAGEAWLQLSPRWPEDGSAVYFNRCVDEGCGDLDIYQATWLILPRFRRGDASGDGALDQSDAIAILEHLFLGAAPPACMDAADANDDGVVDISDPIFALSYQFLGTETPPSPGPSTCGPDPTQDNLSECAYTATNC